MVNTNIQGPIQLGGRGFVAKRNGNYLPGEYKRLTNVEVTEDGYLCNRRTVKSVFGTATGSSVTKMDNPFGFVGNLRHWAILVSGTEQVAVGPDSYIPMWAPTQLTVPAAAESFHKIVGFFRFNNVNYWITMESDTGAHIKLKLFYGDIDSSEDVPATYDNTYFSGLTEVTIFTIEDSDKEFNKFDFNNFFIQGSRLWISTTLGVYFSAATDPTDFTVPNGGFFKFPNQNINWALSLRDNIYVLCDNSLHTINYSTDPNLDSFVTQIADSVGGDHGCVFRDNVYVINQLGVFAIVNNRVEKVVNNEFDVGLDFYKQSLSAFENYLIINKYSDVNYEKFNAESSITHTNLIINPSFESNATGYLGSNTLWTRTRKAPSEGSAYAGTQVYEAKRINDLTQVIRTNLIPNPDIQNNINDWDCSSNFWDLHWYDSSLADNVPDSPSENKMILRCRFHANQDPPGKPIVDGFSDAATTDFLPVEPNTGYRLWFNYLIGGSWPQNKADPYWFVQWYDDEETPIGSIVQGTIDDSAELIWRDTNSTLVTSPSAAAFAKVGVRVFMEDQWTYNTVFSIYIDRINFEKNSTWINNPLEPYFDGDSTPSNPNAFAYEWTGTPGNSPSNKLGSSGGGSGSNTIHEYNQDIDVSPSSSYTVGFALKELGASVSRNINVRIRQFNSSDNLVSDSVISAGSYSDSNWHYMTATFNTTSNAHHVNIWVSSQETVMFDNTFYFDALHLELTTTYNGYFDGSFTDTSIATYSWNGTANNSSSQLVVSNVQRRLFSNGRKFSPGEAGNALGYNTYFLNMDNGAVHVLGFRDARDADIPGYFVDVFANPSKDSSGNYNCFFLANRYVSEDSSGFDFEAHAFYVSSYKDISFIDYAVTEAGILEKYAPQVEIEIDSYVPDGTEYLMKKFRNLFVMAKVPTTDFKVQFGYEDQDYGSAIDLHSTVLPDRPHYPFRIGMNQRGKSVSIKFFNENFETPLATESEFEAVEISDLRLLWTYTGKPVAYRKQQ